MVITVNKGEKLFRYDDLANVGSNLDPLIDVLFWISGLRSKGLVEDILRNIHGYKAKKSIASRTEAINHHAETAIKLLEQGFEGPIETSFLPLYYGMLNLAKIYIIFSENYQELENNRRHGATHKPCKTRNRNFFNDQVELRMNGAFPLFYKTLTKETYHDKYKIFMKDIYPYIMNISHEYEVLTKKKPQFINCDINFFKDGSDGQRLEFKYSNYSDDLPPKYHMNRRYNKILKIFTKRINKDTFSTETRNGEEKDIKNSFKTDCRRFLLYDIHAPIDSVVTVTPISKLQLLLPEEVPIFLAFFHLCNIVRYNPELLFALKNSQEWGMIQALSRHGAYRFLVLFWSFVQNKCYVIHKN